jgi:hypothetical protein
LSPRPTSANSFQNQESVILDRGQSWDLPSSEPMSDLGPKLVALAEPSSKSNSNARPLAFEVFGNGVRRHNTRMFETELTHAWLGRQGAARLAAPTAPSEPGPARPAGQGWPPAALTMPGCGAGWAALPLPLRGHPVLCLAETGQVRQVPILIAVIIPSERPHLLCPARARRAQHRVATSWLPTASLVP